MKNKKVYITGLTLTIILLMATIISFGLYMETRIYNKSITIIDMKYAGSEELAAEIEVSFISGKIALKGEKSFYLVGDDDNIFILSTKEPLPQELEQIMKYSYSVVNEKPKNYTIVGGTYEIPESLKEIAIIAYNDLFENQEITYDNFEEYFGEYYLNIESIYDESENTKLMFFIVFSVLSLVIVTCVLIYYFKQRK